MTVTRSYEDVLGVAVRALTEAARRTVSWIDTSGHEQHQQGDFGEIVTHVVAGTAANLGGIGEALAARPGSWEAACVRDMLRCMVGDNDAELFKHRTEPVKVSVAVDNLLTDLGLWQLYDEAADELDRREFAIWPAPDTSHALAVLSAEQQQVANQIADRRAALEAMRTQDWADYGEAFKTNVVAAAAELFPNLPVPVEVAVRLDWQDGNDTARPHRGPALILWERARYLTPLPGSGIPLKDYPLEPSIAEIERAAGRDPLSRLASEG